MCNIKKQRRIFITGTDTEVGKTVASVVLLHLLKKIGYSTASLKPIAAGVEEKMNVNSDVIFLQENTTNKHTYKEINPYLFQEPIAPHIAARNESIDINIDECIEKCQSILKSDAEFIVIEGAGGLLVPLNHSQTMLDLAIAMRTEIILVVGMKLGCLNHTLLTVDAIKNSGLRFSGWIANHLSKDMPYVQLNIESLKERIDAPFLGEIPFSEKIDPSKMSIHINQKIFP